IRLDSKGAGKAWKDALPSKRSGPLTQKSNNVSATTTVGTQDPRMDAFDFKPTTKEIDSITTDEPEDVTPDDPETTAPSENVTAPIQTRRKPNPGAFSINQVTTPHDKESVLVITTTPETL